MSHACNLPVVFVVVLGSSAIWTRPTPLLPALVFAYHFSVYVYYPPRIQVCMLIT